LIVRHIFDALKIPAPSYLDIGAHDPAYLNNTRIFYDVGARGVNVEPDPALIARFRSERKKDINLNIGIADTEGTLPFYLMNPPTLNTFVKSEAEAAVAGGDGRIVIESVIQVPVLSINNLISDYFKSPPDFLSLDVEGLDLSILKGIDYKTCRPKVICVETITHSQNREGRKVRDIPEWLESQNYFLYADTHINSIFVDRQVW
jgi:FkbM family methyltransferase